MPNRLASPVASDEELVKIARNLLLAADVEAFPTPLERVLDVAKLVKSNALDLERYREPFLKRAQRWGQYVTTVLGRILGVADLQERVIYVREDVHPKKVTWLTGHETGHQVIPWHRDIALYADDSVTLDPKFERMLEAEANAFAGHLIFQNERFDRVAADYKPSRTSVVQLSELCGASIHASVRRFVQRSRRQIAAAVFSLERSAVDVEEDVIDLSPPSLDFRYAIQSQSFTETFGPVSWEEVFSPIIEKDGVAESLDCGLIRVGSLFLTKSPGQRAETQYEAFSNGYDAFFLAVPLHKKALTKARIV